jgi:hypothetical protein
LSDKKGLLGSTCTARPEFDEFARDSSTLREYTSCCDELIKGAGRSQGYNESEREREVVMR